MGMSLKGNIAILIGAGRINGVGAATALLLAEEGCNILINCHKNELQATQIVNDCRKLGVEAELFMADASKSSSCKEMAQYVQQKWGKANILVNCIGMTKIVPYDRLDQLTEDDFAKIFSVNVTAPYLAVQAFEKMLKNSGNTSVVNVSSISAMNGYGSSIAYCASKGALNTLTLSLAQALAPNVRVNAVCPGFIDSSWWEESTAKDTEKYNSLVKSVKERSLLNQIIKPSDVADVIVNIIKSSRMTGELIRLDSGSHLSGSHNTYTT